MDDKGNNMLKTYSKDDRSYLPNGWEIKFKLLITNP
jgi:hypothetical protein